MTGAQRPAPRELRDAFGAFITGVTVVTAINEHDQPLGFTANSFTSVSLDPPLLLVCLSNSSRNYEALTSAPGFGVNVLSEGQKDVSNTFARPVGDRFAAVAWRRGPHGAPILDSVSAWFDCSMHRTVSAGDHAILIGRVEAFASSPAPGLGYARGAYVTPAAGAEALARNAGLIVSVLIERADEVLLLDDGAGGLSLPEARVGKDGATTALAGLIGNSGIRTQPGFIYAVYEDETRGHQHISFLCHAADGAPTRGAFARLGPATLARIADPAMRAMLERFAAESRMGNFGVYFGSHVSGRVRPIAPGS